MRLSRISRGWLAIFLSIVGFACSIRVLWQSWLYVNGDAPNLYVMLLEGLADAFHFMSPSSADSPFHLFDAPFIWVVGLLFWLGGAVITVALFSAVIRAVQFGASPNEDIS